MGKFDSQNLENEDEELDLFSNESEIEGKN